MTAERNTKLKLLRILDILNKETDEKHILTMKELEEKLLNLGISAERKSVTNDITTLKDFGYDICCFDENRKGYFMRSRTFEESELRILIDAVLSSRCITKRKSRTLIDKLETLTSKTMVDRLWSQIYIDDRVKCSYEDIYENIDKINKAISENKKINFNYTTYVINKGWVPCRDGKEYELSPYGLAWHEDFYYVIGLHEKYQDFAHYRVDKMRNITITEEKRKDARYIPECKNGFNTADYMNKTFKMFTGETIKVEIKFNNSLLNAAVDRFGEEAIMRPLDKENFKLNTEVNVGEGFISWILQFGSKVEVLYPEKLREEVKNRIEELKALYE